jgi:hypothetical protein
VITYLSLRDWLRFHEIMQNDEPVEAVRRAMQRRVRITHGHPPPPTITEYPMTTPDDRARIIAWIAHVRAAGELAVHAAGMATVLLRLERPEEAAAVLSLCAPDPSAPAAVRLTCSVCGVTGGMLLVEVPSSGWRQVEGEWRCETCE